jgi:hypothetical protein
MATQSNDPVVTVVGLPATACKGFVGNGERFDLSRVQQTDAGWRSRIEFAHRSSRSRQHTASVARIAPRHTQREGGRASYRAW